MTERPKDKLEAQENLMDLFKSSSCFRKREWKSRGEDILKIIQETF